MIEVEVKYPLPDWARVEAVLAWGWRVVEDRLHVDQYINAPDRDFAATDEALRLRRVGRRERR